MTILSADKGRHVAYRKGDIYSINRMLCAMCACDIYQALLISYDYRLFAKSIADCYPILTSIEM